MAVGSVGTAGAAVAVHPSASTARARSQWRFPSTSALVHRVVRAHSARARVRAIERLLGSLGVGVYSNNGRMIVGGFERNSNGIYLYDFEVKLLADQFASKRLGSFNQIAAQLRRAHEKLGHRLVSGRSLAKAVAKGIRRLMRSKAPGAALAQVVYRLGLARHVNLLHPPNPNKRVLDSVQRILIGIDATRSAGGLGGVPHARYGRAASAAAVVGTAAGAGGCRNGYSGGKAYTKKIVTMIATKGKKKSLLGDITVLVNEIRDGIDGVAMAYSVGMKPVKTHVKGAFGTHGPNSAAPVRFQVRVIMRDDYTQGKPGCGRLAGYEVPHKGPISGVPVVWKRDVQSHLSYLGRTPSCGTICVTHTNSSGVATMLFKPEDEYLPGVGLKVFRHGSSAAVQLIQAAQHNVLGTISEALGMNKEALIRWDISYHHPTGYRVNLPAQTFSVSGGKVTWAPKNLEVCLEKSTRDIPNPLRPYWTGPLVPGGKRAKGGSGDAPLGSQGTSGKKALPSGNSASPYWGDLAETLALSGTKLPVLNHTPFEIPIGFDTTGTFQDVAAKSKAQWSFTGSSLRAHITLDYSLPSGKSRSFNVPVSQAKYCSH